MRESVTENSLDRTPVLSADVTLLRCPDVLKRVALKRTALYALIKAGKFPAPVKVGGASAWVDLEITRWIERLMSTRDDPPTGRIAAKKSPGRVRELAERSDQ